MQAHRNMRLSAALGILALLSALVGLASGPPASMTASSPASPASFYHPIYEFNHGYTYHVTLARRDDLFVVAYMDASNSFYGTARVGLLVNNQITYGPEVVFNAGNTSDISLAFIGSNTIVIAFCDVSDNDEGKMVIGTLSGNSLSFGSVYNFSTHEAHSISVDNALTNQFVIAYQKTSTYPSGEVAACAYSGGAISCGSHQTFNAAETSFVTVNVLADSPAYFVLAYRDNGDSGWGKMMAGSISGGEITLGSETFFNSITGHISVADLTAFTLALVYRDESNSNYGTAQIIGRTNLNLNTNTEYVFNTGDTMILSSFGVTDISGTRFAVGFYTGAYVGRTVFGDLSSTDISFSEGAQFNPGEQSDLPAVSAYRSGFITCWSDKSDSDRGKCRVYGIAWLFMPRLSK
ncbi:MAG: hypothetical protein JXB15_13955 [Anaerolineales bacterium]|nr:hypothetical protein [Anaerolineales bacterium]